MHLSVELHLHLLLALRYVLEAFVVLVICV